MVQTRYHVILPPELRSPGRARRLLRDVLTEHDLLELQDAAEVALSELVTNAVLHAHTDVEVTIHCSDTELRVEARDGSSYSVAEPANRATASGDLPRPLERNGDNPDREAATDYGDIATTGRGIALVAAFTDSYGVIPEGDRGKTVWFALSSLSHAPASEQSASWDNDESRPARTSRVSIDRDKPLGQVTVTLLGFPPTLWLAASLQHDMFLRELALLSADEPHRQTHDALAAADRARFTIKSALADVLEAAREAGEVVNPLPDGHPARLDHVPPRVDLPLTLDPDASKDFSCLQDVLDEAQRMSLTGRLLATPALPEVIALGDWAAEQIITLLAGETARAWPGADADEFTRRVDTDAAALGQEADGLLAGVSRGILVDVHNRISGITPLLAEELGWEPTDLLGRRVVALIPARFRESHTAGFTRHLTTGEARALDIDLELPVLHAEGHEISYVFRIHALRARTGTPVYRASLRSVEEVNSS